MLRGCWIRRAEALPCLPVRMGWLGRGGLRKNQAHARSMVYFGASTAELAGYPFVDGGSRERRKRRFASPHLC